MIINDQTTYKTKNGYLFFKHNRKSVHRCVMEEYLAKRGEKLHLGEVVHHIDHNRLNNDINNLEVMPGQREHYIHHKNIEREERRNDIFLDNIEDGVKNVFNDDDDDFDF